MKKIFNNSKRGIAVILTLCILIGIAGTCVHAAVVDETTQVTDEPTQELMPMMASRCSYPSLDQYLKQNASTYGYSVSDVEYGSNISLSNGYYYHAGQYGSNLQCFIYDSSGNCVASSYLSA